MFLTSGLLLMFFNLGSTGAAMAAIVAGAGAIGIFSGILHDVWKEGKDAGD